MVLKTKLLLLDPAPTDGGGGISDAAPAIPSVSLPTRQIVSAADALGLDEPSSNALGAEFDRNKKNLPPETAGLPKPEPAAKPPAAKKPAKPAAEPKATAAKAEPAKPAEPKKPETPAAPAEPKKIKIGGKEYTEEELAKILDGPKPAPQAEPAKPAAPTPEPPKPPSAEEIAQAESKWVQQQAEAFSVDLTPEQLESVLGGGEDGVKALKSIVATNSARAILQARKQIFEEVNRTLVPDLASLHQALNPLVENQQQLTAYTTEQLFASKHPAFKEHIDVARSIGQTLMQKYPDQVRQMDQQGFIDEVARQTDKYLTEQYNRFRQPADRVESWAKHYAEEQAKAAQPAPPTPAPAAPTPEPTPEPAPAAPPVLPPGANPPAVSPSAPKGNFQKSVAHSLREG